VDLSNEQSTGRQAGLGCPTSSSSDSVASSLETDGDRTWLEALLEGLLEARLLL
jgi:hypothetical protein